MAELEGGCLCGAVRYRVSGPGTSPCHCHCRSCRLASGAPFVAWATFERAHFRLLRGEPAQHRSSDKVMRGFCGACGTCLTWATADAPGHLDVALATLDEPGAIRPACHIWVSHRLPWVALADGLPQFAERWGDG